VANGRTGTVFIEDFDVGLARSVGAELIEIELDGERVQEFALRVRNVTGPDEYHGMVPVIFQNPETSVQVAYLPRLEIVRSSIVTANERRFFGGREYRVPASVARTVKDRDGRGLSGPTLAEQKKWTRPFDITYDLHMRARLEKQAQYMLKQIGKVVFAIGQIFVTDSEGELRGYNTFDATIDNLSEVADVEDRTTGYTISIRVEGELDFDEPYLVKTVTGITTTLEPKVGGT